MKPNTFASEQGPITLASMKHQILQKLLLSIINFFVKVYGTKKYNDCMIKWTHQTIFTSCQVWVHFTTFSLNYFVFNEQVTMCALHINIHRNFTISFALYIIKPWKKENICVKSSLNICSYLQFMHHNICGLTKFLGRSLLTIKKSSIDRHLTMKSPS